MIELKGITKKFSGITVLNAISLEIKPGKIYGLVGTNGSGKSTMLRILSGVYSVDSGEALLDEQPIFENPDNKERVFFVSDDLYFHPQSTLNSMAKFYRAAYPRWQEARYTRLCELFPIGINKKLATFSKGMRRQAAFILALSAAPDYLLLDEAFDGLDAVIRHAVRKIIADVISEHNICVIISSHNLRELEDFCDRVCLLHDGLFKMECDVDDIHSGFTKIQMVLRPMPEKLEVEGVRILSQEVKGSVATVICAVGEQEALDAVNKLSPMLTESVPLNLEEVFIYEMEAVGYDYNKIIF